MFALDKGAIFIASFKLQQNYEDKMEFSTSQGTFTLQLQGLLPETNLHIPKSIHFGLSAVHEAAQLSFEIRNLRYRFRRFS